MRLTGRWLVLVCGTTALLQAVFYGVRVLVTYRTLALDGGVGTVGMITALFSLVPLLIAIPVGRWIDGGRTGLVFRLGIALTIVGILMVQASSSIAAIGVGAMVIGGGQLLATVASQAFVSLLARRTKNDLDKGFAALTLSVSIGQAFGVPIVGLVVGRDADGRVQTGPALLVMAVIAVIALVVLWGVRDTRVMAAGSAREARQSAPRMLRTPGLPPAIYNGMVVLAALDLTVAYLPVIGEARGFDVGIVTVLITARTIASVVARALLPTLLGRIPRGVLLVCAVLVPAPAVAMIPFVECAWGLGVLLAVVGFFWGVGQPLAMTWVVSLVDPANRGAALSLRLMGNRVGQVVIPTVAGVLSGIGGVAAVRHQRSASWVGRGLVLARRPRRANLIHP